MISVTSKMVTTLRARTERHPILTPLTKSSTRFRLLGSINLLVVLLLTTSAFLLEPATSLQSHRQHKSSTVSPSLCHKSWHHIGLKCYKIIYNHRALESARTRCRDLSSELVTVDEDVQPAKEDDASEGVPSMKIHSFNIDISNLISYIDTNMSIKFYYVNLSPSLLRQYKEKRSADRVGPIGETDLDYEQGLSDLWHKPEDLASLDSLKPGSMENPGFGLARLKDRWGLIAVDPSKKGGLLCEMATSRHHVRNQPEVPGEHQAANSQNSASGVASTTSSNHDSTHIRSTDLRKAVSNKETTQASSSLPQVPPPDVSTSLLFRDIPQSQSIVMGSTSEMRCSPIDQESSLVWTFDGKNLTQTSRIRLHPNGTLRIEHVRNTDGGNYTCTINSGGVSESRWARLEIIQRPHQPDYVEAKLLDKISTSVRVEWAPGFNGNSPIVKYLVEMRTIASSSIDHDLSGIMQSSQWETARANISADTTNVIIQDLKPAKRYIFRVRAANRIGVSDPSMPTNPPIEVPIQPPSLAPEGLSGSPRSATSIAVQWLPPPSDSQNGAIKSYKIRHKLAGYAGDTDWYTNDVPEATHLNFVLDDLITWQNYEIQVAAENDKGVGPYSSSIFVRTKEGTPDKGPRNVSAGAVSSTKIKITWNAPPPEHINGVNLGYKVSVLGESSANEQNISLVVPHSGLTPLQATTVEGLYPYSEYQVLVRCFTNGGDGVPNEDKVTVRTKQDLPEAIESIEFADVLDKSLRIIWRPPKHVNGELSQYLLEYWETSNVKKSSKIFPPSITETKINDLNPETQYTFRIVAYTEIGFGPERISQVRTSVPPVVPEPPSNLKPVIIGPYSVTIQFEPGFDGNAAIDKWIAEAQVASLGDYTPRWQAVYIANSSQGNSVVVRNLRPFTKYKIRLTPVNIVGQSRYPSSATPEFLTWQVVPEHAPKDLTIEEVKTNSAIARWSPLSNTNWLGIPHGYNLTWTESNNSAINFQLINDTRADSFFIKDLEEFTSYTFTIYAVNDAGLSAPSEPVTIMTLEDVPSSGPTNLTAKALTSTTISVDWNTIPKKHRNGIIRGYKIQYQMIRPNAAVQFKSIEENNTKHVILNDLKPFTTYQLAVAAYTAVGDGVLSPNITIRTLEDTPGLPQNVSFPTVSQNSARILWDPPEDTNGDILGYRVSYYAYSEGNSNKEVASHELAQNERTFKATDLKPLTNYVFSITAKTKEGWGQQASTLVYTSDSEMRANLPFYREGWFVILCACSSIVITIIVTALLFIQTKSYKYKQEAIKSTSQDRLGDAGFTIEEDPGSHYNNGFGLLSNSANHRRSNGALSQSTANFTLPKTPPRPHPGTAVDSDEDDDVFEDNVGRQAVKSIAGTSNYDSSSDSVTEKPSEISSSPAPESESADDEYVNMANKHFVNHYANVNGTLRSQRSWRRNGQASSSKAVLKPNHYGTQRTTPKLPQRPAPSVPQVPQIDHSQSSDSGPSQPVSGTSGTQNQIFDQMDLLNNNHTVPLNGGRIIVDNMAGSRAPLPGFTSFNFGV